MELLQQIKDFLIPELDAIRQEQGAIRDRLNSIDMHLVDQSRRIDETNKRIDRVQADFIGRIDETHRRLDRLYEVVVQRDEHDGLDRWVQSWSQAIERRLEALERKVAQVNAEEIGARDGV